MGTLRLSAQLLGCLCIGACGAGTPAGGSGPLEGASGAGGEASGDLEDLVLPGFPHHADVYATAHAKRAVVLLHGGGGRSEDLARQLGLHTSPSRPTTDTVSWSWLKEHNVIAVLPQGQSITSAASAFTWSNRVMTSGQDDMAYLSLLAEYLRASYGVAHVYLMGHSNGGMMANRFWCEAPATFDGYIAVAGPASVDYLDGAHCHPEPAQPYYAIVGDQDSVLQVSQATFQALTWEIRPLLVAAAGDAFLNPTLLGEWQQQAARSRALCGEELSASAQSAAVTSWANCDGRLLLELVSGGDHAPETLEAASGERLLDAAAKFMVTLER